MTAKASKKWEPIYGALALIALSVNTFLCFIPIVLIGLTKLVPNQQWRIYCSRGIDQLSVFWSKMNSAVVNRFYTTEWIITGDTQFDPKQWYLVMTNHQSALDILVAQHVFHQKIPPLKFFIKDELKWVPIFGLLWWMAGFPFMKRYSKEYLQKNPHKKGSDIQTTNKALKLFKQTPSSLISFVEGTRYTLQKKQNQQSPYQHLLKPKAGGIHQVICTMGKQLQSLIDVTIVYPNPRQSLWDFLCRRVDSIIIDVRTLPIPNEFRSSANSFEDNDTQNAFRTWLNEQWAVKDALIKRISNKL